MADIRPITGGRALPHEVVEELQHRYSQIGLRDTPGKQPPPLTRWTLAQARSLEAALAAGWHSAPRLRRHAQLASVHRRRGCPDPCRRHRLIAICLAPQNSRTSIGLYRRALMSVADGLDVTFVEEWPERPP